MTLSWQLILLWGVLVGLGTVDGSCSGHHHRALVRPTAGGDWRATAAATGQLISSLLASLATDHGWRTAVRTSPAPPFGAYRWCC
jgi:hypothetical protein